MIRTLILFLLTLISLSLPSERVMIGIAQANIPHIASSVDWHKNGNLIAIGYEDGSIEIQDASTSQITQTFEAKGFIQLLRWNPIDGRLAGVSGLDVDNWSLWILDTATGSLLEGLKGSFSIGDLDWNNDGSQLVTTENIGMGSQYLVQIWNTAPGQFEANQTLHLEKHILDALDWNPVNNRWIALVQDDGLLAIWDLQTNDLASAITASLSNETDMLRSISWSPNGDKLATLDDSTTVQIWNWNGVNLSRASLFTNTNLATLGIGTIQWSPDGDKIAVIQSRSVKIINAQTGIEIEVTPPIAFLNSAAWSPDSTKLIYVGRQDNNDLNSGIIRIFTSPAFSTPTPS